MKHKPYKKTYRANEKVYRIIVEDDYGRLSVRIAKNTIKSIHKVGSYMTRGGVSSRLYGTQLKSYNDKYDFEYIENIAPQTKKGKDYLKKIAQKIVKAKLKSCQQSVDNYNVLLKSFEIK